MRIFLAGETYYDRMADIIMREHPYVLVSYYYADKTTEKYLPYYGDFLLDSGAYTLRQNVKGEIDWERYIDQYADFINRNNVDKFFELDIDNLVGFDEVKRLRERLEDRTQKQCITVWHPSRGWDDFVEQTKERPYVSLGGIVGARKGSDIYRKYQAAFPAFISKAHENGAKIHGLGYTSIAGLRTNHFDSVDSTTWTSVGRFGELHLFTGDGMIRTRGTKGRRIGNNFEGMKHNYQEWVKFQKYADTHL